jgi:hypothetical protein
MNVGEKMVAHNIGYFNNSLNRLKQFPQTHFYRRLGGEVRTANQTARNGQRIQTLATFVFKYRPIGDSSLFLKNAEAYGMLSPVELLVTDGISPSPSYTGDKRKADDSDYDADNEVAEARWHALRVSLDRLQIFHLLS